jgi:hypothetical protein
MESDEEDGEEEDSEEEEGDSSEEDVPIEGHLHQTEQREGSMETEIIEENPSENAYHPRRLGPKEIHEFHNVGAWLRRKR